MKKFISFPLTIEAKSIITYMENKIARIDKIAAASEQAADALKNVERRIADMAVLIKNIATYQKTKPVYEAYKKTKNKEQFRAAHESDLILVLNFSF